MKDAKQANLADMTPEERAWELNVLWRNGDLNGGHDFLAALRDADRKWGWNDGYAAGKIVNPPDTKHIDPEVT